MFYFKHLTNIMSDTLMKFSSEFEKGRREPKLKTALSKLNAVFQCQRDSREIRHLALPPSQSVPIELFESYEGGEMFSPIGS